MSNLFKKKTTSHFSLIAAIYFASVLWRPEHGGEVRKKYWKETVIVIKWIAVHEYCNVDLHLYNLIFVLVAYEAVSHWFYTTERGLKKGGGEKLEQVFLFCFCFCVADYRRYNLYFIVCNNLAMSERLLSGIFTKEFFFSGADNSKNTNSSISDPSSVTDVMIQIMT
jgi:hypothetical protein